MFCASYGKSCRDTFAVNGLKELASFNDFCQFVLEQADLATDPVYSEEDISRPMDTVDKYRKSGERKTKRGRGTKFATGLSGKKGTGENSRPVSCTFCAKVHHLDECAKFLKKTSSRAERLQKKRVMLWFLQF